MDELFEFIQQNCVKYNIDESHGLKHAKGTTLWAAKLMSYYSDITREEKDMILYGAALHDMCDSKYRDVNDAATEIHQWLKANGWSEQMATTLINIITSMSYTKLKTSQKEGQNIVYPNHGSMQRAYHIIRHSDLLEAYRVSRCFLYSLRKWPNWSEDDLWAETQKTFDSRIFKYVSDGWIFLEPALQFIPDLESTARRCLKERDNTYIL